MAAFRNALPTLLVAALGAGMGCHAAGERRAAPSLGSDAAPSDAAPSEATRTADAPPGLPDGPEPLDGAASADAPPGRSNGGAGGTPAGDGPTNRDATLERVAGSDASDAASFNPAASEQADRADQALAALMLNFWTSLAANTSTYDWQYAHEWEAVLDAVDRRGNDAFAGTARMFYDLQARRGWLDDFYDDEDWVALTLLHAYHSTKEPMYLARAKAVFADIMAGWDTTCCGAHLGGIWWNKAHQSKATASNAGPVIAAARLYEYTHDATYLDFARKAFTYWSTYMMDATSGHVYDNVSANGAVNTTWTFTYNEGLLIGAAVAMADVTGDAATYLPLAHKAAGFMLAHETESVAGGTILSDGKCSGDGNSFKAVGARYLEQLYERDRSQTTYRDFLVRSADAAWTLARDPVSGKISCDWKGPFDPTAAQVGALESAAIGIAAAARALGPAPSRAPLLYEAEEGNLHGAGVEATHAGYGGWGYVAAWGSDGQSVDMLVDVPAAGSYGATLRYAAASDAARIVSVNGAAGVKVAFPGTGGYDHYGTVAQTLALPAGRSTVTLTLSTAAGASGYVNLDALALTAAP